MTGEISLRGRVMPVGGIKEKILAAVAQGMKRVIMPSQNKKDLQDIPEDLRAKINIKFVEDVDEVWPLARTSSKAPAKPAAKVIAKPTAKVEAKVAAKVESGPVKPVAKASVKPIPVAKPAAKPAAKAAPKAPAKPKKK
jgi:ATP-dependent Lon protease